MNIVQVSTGQLQTVHIVNVDNGIYAFDYTLMIVDDYKMDISVQFNGLGSYYALSTSPFMIKCHVTTTDPFYTVLTGLGLTNAMAGVVESFTVTLFDSGDNQQ